MCFACGSTCSCANIPCGGIPCAAEQEFSWLSFMAGGPNARLCHQAAVHNKFLTVPHEPRCRALFEISPLFVRFCVRRRIRWKYGYRESLSCCL
jgi:hypothetical protein